MTSHVATEFESQSWHCTLNHNLAYATCDAPEEPYLPVVAGDSAEAADSPRAAEPPPRASVGTTRVGAGAGATHPHSPTPTTVMPTYPNAAGAGAASARTATSNPANGGGGGGGGGGGVEGGGESRGRSTDALTLAKADHKRRLFEKQKERYRQLMILKHRANLAGVPPPRM